MLLIEWESKMGYKLKSVQVASYPQEYLTLYDFMSSGDKDLRDFMNKVEEITFSNTSLETDDDKFKFKGDMLEVLSEIFFSVTSSDERYGLSDYTPVEIQDDYGTDATGRNVNGHQCAVQVKYRRNVTDKIEYTDLAKTFVSGLKRHECDLHQPHTLFLFTTCSGVTIAAEEVLGDHLVILDYNIINKTVSHNINFWEYAYNSIVDKVEDNSI